MKNVNHIYTIPASSSSYFAHPLSDGAGTGTCFDYRLKDKCHASSIIRLKMLRYGIEDHAVYWLQSETTEQQLTELNCQDETKEFKSRQ